MTDPTSASRGRRRRSGRHLQPARRQRATPIPPEEARRNRDAAFGSPNPRRTWIGTPSGTASSGLSAPSADSAGSATEGEQRRTDGAAAAMPPAGSSARRSTFPGTGSSPAAGPQGSGDDPADPDSPVTPDTSPAPDGS
ncbi:MAG TPA: hypothetical protein K8V81_05170, partial [Brachybacterium massiliense]|nr:hypothetical protein [Brachybacterium massiliense]